MKIQMFLIPKQLKTYSQVLTIAREVEWGLEKNYDKMQKRLTKRPSQLMDGEDSVRLINVPLTKRSFQPSLPQSVCNFCHKPGYYKRDCRMANFLSQYAISAISLDTASVTVEWLTNYA